MCLPHTPLNPDGFCTDSHHLLFCRPRRRSRTTTCRSWWWSRSAGWRWCVRRSPCLKTQRSAVSNTITGLTPPSAIRRTPKLSSWRWAFPQGQWLSERPKTTQVSVRTTLATGRVWIVHSSVDNINVSEILYLKSHWKACYLKWWCLRTQAERCWWASLHLIMMTCPHNVSTSIERTLWEHSLFGGTVSSCENSLQELSPLPF